ncbi:MAG: hypothetical protein P1P85_04135 [Patescibacteria group bacterium]|nr:hypothetical protein [Patescibacteria group bacterium]
MSRKQFAAGEELTATKLNQNIIAGSYNAGETINGATLPVAVFVKASDGEIYACDADDSTKLDFIGFAITNSTDANPITVQTDGIVNGFTGLTVGSSYYVQNNKTIGTSKGTATILVGRAISSTELIILKEEKPKYMSGTTSKNLADASGIQNIAHGLGKTPKKIKLHFTKVHNSTTGTHYYLDLVYNGTTTSVIGVLSDGNYTVEVIGSTLKIISGSSANYQIGVLSFDATNIIITWTKSGTPTGTHFILWEAEA